MPCVADFFVPCVVVQNDCALISVRAQLFVGFYVRVRIYAYKLNAQLQQIATKNIQNTMQTTIENGTEREKDRDNDRKRHNTQHTSTRRQ